jgi:hypothetical protein
MEQALSRLFLAGSFSAVKVENAKQKASDPHWE